MNNVLSLEEKMLEENELSLEETKNLVSSIRDVNKDVESIFEQLKEQLGKDTRNVKQSDLKSLRSSINKLKMVLADIIE